MQVYFWRRTPGCLIAAGCATAKAWTAASIVNLTDRKYWLWSDVQGPTRTSASTLVDAYTQSGRQANVALVVAF